MELRGPCGGAGYTTWAASKQDNRSIFLSHYPDSTVNG